MRVSPGKCKAGKTMDGSAVADSAVGTEFVLSNSRRQTRTGSVIDRSMHPFSVAELRAFKAEDYEVVEKYLPDVAFPGREGLERLRALWRAAR